MKRTLLVFLLVLLGALFLLAVDNWATRGRLSLQLEHSLRSSLRRHVTVATLHVESVGRIRMFLNPDDRGLTPTIMKDGIWEPNETYWFTRSVQEGDTVLDIGANVGYYTLLGAILVGETGRVYAFEPDPVSFRLLERNVRLNGLHNVVLEQKAVSDKPGTLRLYLAEKNKGDHKIFATDEQRESIEVEAISLDDYFDGYTGRIDFVKIDTQGAEAIIVQGMKTVLRNYEEMHLAVEFAPSALDQFGFSAEDFLQMLQSFGFRFFDLGIWAKRPWLKEKSVTALTKQYTVKNRTFTNLFLTRDHAPPGQSKPK